VKGYIFGEIGNTVRPKFALDLAAGKGQDINRYADLGVKSAIFVDIDSNALQELVERKRVLRNPMAVVTLEQDLTEPYKKVVDNITALGLPEEGSPLVMSHLAIHYLIHPVTQLQNFIGIVKNTIALGGHFVFTCFDGRAVFNLLQKHNNHWTARVGEVLKYSIKFENTTTEFSNGIQISLLLPFSDGEHYTERLVDLDLVKAEFGKNGFECVQSASYSTVDGFGKMAKGGNDSEDENGQDDLPASVTGGNDELSNDDRIFISLYSYTILKRVSE
jgi:hypothetical protein